MPASDHDPASTPADHLDTGAPVDPELSAERDYLARARDAMARMRERTLALDTQAGDAVSAAYLARTLHLRAASLADDPATTLFFGRLDTDGGERWYVGRRHVADEAGDPMVIDWRAEMSTAFYRATRRELMGVVLRRRFGLDRGVITALEDEHLHDTSESESRSQILSDEIERPRVGPMRDIVATIQPEQDEIVRADAATSVCVQGAPGTGKTAVGLHRAAWLLYAFRDKLSRQGVLVIGPNRAFLEHIGAVLPALGEAQVGHTTAEDLLESAPVKGVDSAEVAVLKGDSRLAEVIRGAVWDRVRAPEEPLIVPRGSRRWRVPAYDIAEIVEQLKGRGIRYDAAREMLPQRLAHLVLLRMEAAGAAPDDRVQDSVARSTPVKRYAAELWPKLDPREVLFGLFSDPEALARHAEGVLSPEEQALLLWPKPPRTKGSARWSRADMALLDEISGQLERLSSLGHVVLDEAQDLSPMQLRAVGRRVSTGAVTVLGDIAQGTTPWSTSSWEETLAHLGKPDGHIEVLDRGFRVPASVIDFASRLLPHMAPGLGAPQAVRSNPGRLVMRESDQPLADAAAVVAQELREPGSVGVIVADLATEAMSTALSDNGIEHGVLGAARGDVEHRVDVVPATVAKGLEFDRVIVVEPAAIAAAEPDERTGLRRLYVVLTRAVTGLTVIHHDPLPLPLALATP